MAERLRRLEAIFEERTARIEEAVRALADRTAALEERLETPEETRDRSRRRWRRAAPDRDLTWRRALSGDAFVDKLEQHGRLTAGSRVIEVGPGYGRLVRVLLARGLPFGSYVGLDLSAANVAALEDELGGPRVRFLHGDVEEQDLGADADLVYSSLVFKHLYPSCERALAHLARHTRPGGRLIFDLIEGEGEGFEPDGVTFIRRYRRGEIPPMLERTAWRLVTFDTVVHDSEHPRLLVVAERAASPPSAAGGPSP